MPVILDRKDSAHSDIRRSTVGEASILVVPTKRRIRHLTREVVSKSNVVAGRLNLFTLELLALEIFRAAYDVRVIEDPIKTLLFGQALEASRNELQYFSVRTHSGSLPRGTLDKIIHVISHLKEYGIYPFQLLEELASEEDEDKPKLKDIVTLYVAYEEALTELDSVDTAGVFRLLAFDCPEQTFASAFREVFPLVQSVSIDGFDEFTEPELAVIRKLTSLDIDMSVVFDFQHGNDSLFGHLTENYRRFIEMGFAPASEPGCHDLWQRRQDATVRQILDHARQHLFTRAPVAKMECSNHVTLASAKDRLAEVELICKLIKNLKAQNPSLDLSRVCVALYRPQVYTHLMREQFARFGIQANITDRFELSQSPVVAAVIGLLEVAVRGFRRDDVLRSVGAAYFEFLNNGTPIDASNLLAVAREVRVVGGIRGWTKTVERAVNKHRRDILMSADEEENARRARRIDALHKALSDILWLESLLADVAADQTPAQFFRHFCKLLDTVKLPQRLFAVGVTHHPDLVEQDARAYAKLLEVAEQAVDLMEFQHGTSQRHALGFYVEQMKLAISQERYNVREQLGQGVLITSIDETRGLPLDVMIVAGLVDGEFPSTYQSELFFGSGRLRERERRHSWENRYLFYQAITNWSDHLYLTFPEQEADLDLVRSSFVDAFLDIADVERWSYPGNTPLENTIYAEGEYLRFRGRNPQSFASAVAKTTVSPSLLARVAHADRALAIESSRTEDHVLPEYEGCLADALSAEAKQHLETLRHRVYSVSQLETYGKCPYQFFAQRLLRLNVVEDVDEEFSPLDKGSVLHDILFEFYTERRERKLPPLVGCSDSEFDEALMQLLGIAGRKLAELDIPDAFWELEKELILGDKQRGEGLLAEFLDFERNRSTSLRPVYFEVGFGSQLGAQTRIDRSFSSAEPILAGNVQLRGKVDRVETNDRIFTVVDYKTGKDVPKLEDIRAGISLQLPIYLYTIEQLLIRTGQDRLMPAGGVYYQVRTPAAMRVGVGSEEHKGEFGLQRSNPNLVGTDEELLGIIAESVHRVNVYVDEMARGKFPLTTADKIDAVCTYCDYRTVCRIQTVRRVERPSVERP